MDSNLLSFSARARGALYGLAIGDALAMPVHCYYDLAAKYHENPRAGMIANTMLGGNKVHRGAILGALLGAAHGEEAWPRDWRDGLICPPPLLAFFEAGQDEI